MGTGWAGSGLGSEKRRRQWLGHTGRTGTVSVRSAKIRATCLKAHCACSVENGWEEQGRLRGDWTSESVSVVQVRSEDALDVSHE